MYKNVNAEFARGDITFDMVAERLDRTPNTIRLKLKGEYPLTLNEAKGIQALIYEINGRLVPLEELFEEAS